MLYYTNSEDFKVNNTEFYKSFSFKVIELKNPKHTDNSMGITSYFVARMRSGSGMIVYENRKELHLKEGDVFFLPLGLKYHSYWTPDPIKNEVSWDSFAFEHIPLKSNLRLMPCSIPLTEKLNRLFNGISKTKKVNCKNISALYSIIDIILQERKELILSDKAPILEKVDEYLKMNRDFSVKNLATECRMSQSGLYLWFKKNLKMTPVDYKNRQRVSTAVNLLSYTDMTLEEITSLTGFNSVAHLRNLIKNIYNKTPSQIRRENKLI
ncbi:MAG: helix-turn-helix transcriptional regulator [Clostridia bacterium]|nr:helix-turn-helix transcriptional regulator [Clostridia bacterium]